MLNKALAFIRGAYEFRRSFTTAYDDPADLEAYETGRDLAHRLTFRRYDNA